MSKLIADFKEYYVYIETKPFFRKYCGKISIKNKVKVIAETELAILIREKIQTDKEMYSNTQQWIPKSLLIKFEKIENGCKHQCKGASNEHLSDCGICCYNMNNWDDELGWIAGNRSYIPI